MMHSFSGVASSLLVVAQTALAAASASRASRSLAKTRCKRPRCSNTATCAASRLNLPFVTSWPYLAKGPGVLAVLAVESAALTAFRIVLCTVSCPALPAHVTSLLKGLRSRARRRRACPDWCWWFLLAVGAFTARYTVRRSRGAKQWSNGLLDAYQALCEAARVRIYSSSAATFKMLENACGVAKTAANVACHVLQEVKYAWP